MSGHGHGGPSLIGTLFTYIVIPLLIMFALWYYTGGPDRAKNQKPFLKPLTPVDTGETYGPEDQR